MGFLLIAVPYVAAAVFLLGFARRVSRWAATPVPFRIPTTAGQQRSLSFLAPARLDGASTRLGVIGRLALEVLFFRSLLRDTGHARHSGLRLVFPGRAALWLAGLAFHWSLLVVLLRHLRFVTEPVPALVAWLAAADGFLHAGTPTLYATDVVLLGALAYLLARRLRDPLLRYLTLPADYLALGLLLAIAGSGVLMRYAVRPDVAAAKAFALGLVSLHPAPYGQAFPAAPPHGASLVGTACFALHVLLASAPVAVFPFTKLMHAAGTFLAPTHALPNDSRRRRHVNPWNTPVKVHTYEEWEAEFRDKIQAAGLPLEAVGERERVASAPDRPSTGTRQSALS